MGSTCRFQVLGPVAMLGLGALGGRFSLCWSAKGDAGGGNQEGNLGRGRFRSIGGFGRPRDQVGWVS